MYAELTFDGGSIERYYGYSRALTNAGEISTATVNLNASYQDLAAQVRDWYEINLPERGFQTNVYVDQDTGDDTNIGSIDLPVATLTTALAQVEAGGIIRVTGGNYFEDMLVIDKVVEVMGSYDPTFSVQDRLGTPTSIRTSQTSFGAGFQGVASIYVTNTGNLTLSEAVVSSGLFDSLPTHAIVVDGGSVTVTETEIRAGVPDGTTAVTDSYGIRIFNSTSVSLQSVDFASGSEVYPPTLLHALRSESFAGSLAINSSSFTTPSQTNPIAQEYVPISLNATATADIEIADNDISFAQQSAISLSRSLEITGEDSGVGTRITVTGNSIREVGNAGGSNNGLTIESGGEVTVRNNELLWIGTPRDTVGNLVSAMLVTGNTNQVTLTANDVSIGDNGGTATQALRVEAPATIINNVVIVTFNNAINTTSSALALGNPATDSIIVHNSLQARGSAVRIEGTTVSSLAISNNLLWRTSGTQAVIQGPGLNSALLAPDAINSNFFIGAPQVAFDNAFNDIGVLNGQPWANANQAGLPAELSLVNLRPTATSPATFIEGGSNAYLGLVPEDFDGNARTGSVSIGAFEYD
ncbi:MAG: hypothetical protein LC641_11565 [Spirochaeta sp.]|nr:hypothetical protein [Spirochaeta sp.]